MVPSDFDLGLYPYLRLAIGAIGVHVHPVLFPREEEEPVPHPAEDRRTHASIIP